ncbi:MAG: methionyl-tRNA formyltransferase [Gemmatimonadales bacterium]|nr:MAG: methionyl-tRNA formyltransferase [Gemmatimonadales bacterium]
MRILFWGTPDFALPSLRALVGEGHDVVGVVTQPDRPAGRGRKLRASPVKELALEEGVPVLTPHRPVGEAFEAQLRELDPELSVVVAYGHILRPAILELPPRGSVNVHASLLPLLRGAAPVNWAVARGHDRTGVTIMQMSEGMDAGPILLQREIPISPEDSATDLYLRLAELGAQALIEALVAMEAGLLEPLEQDHEAATYAPKVDRDTARIDWARPPREVADHIRGMDMVPGAWTTLKGEPVKLFSPRALDSVQPEDAVPVTLPAPGAILVADAERGLVVATGAGGRVTLDEIQPPGKRRMPASDWLRGRGELPPEERFR